MVKTAIIGAGIAGLACTEALQAAGHAVMLFEKSRSAGGRTSTRRIATPLGDAQFDHGAQYFTARDPRFQARVERWQAAGVVLPWPAAGADAWVGVPGMNAPVKAMAAGCEVRSSMRIGSFERQDGGWRVLQAVAIEVRQDSAGADAATDAALTQDELFEAVVIALPAEQAATLLSPVHAAFAAEAAATPSAPCWTLMLAFDRRLDGVGDILRDSGAIGWAARNSAKPGRSGPEAWVIQAGPAWSMAHLEVTSEVAAAMLQREFAVLAGITLPEVLVSIAHRWRYARSGTFGQPALWDDRVQLGVCGDWLIGPRVEAAWISGTVLAERIIAGG